MPTIEEAAKRTVETITQNRGEARQWLRAGGYQCTVRDEPHLVAVTGGRNPRLSEYRAFEALVTVALEEAAQ